MNENEEDWPDYRRAFFPQAGDITAKEIDGKIVWVEFTESGEWVEIYEPNETTD